jgi:hypothetical protein
LAPRPTTRISPFDGYRDAITQDVHVDPDAPVGLNPFDRDLTLHAALRTIICGPFSRFRFRATA